MMPRDLESYSNAGMGYANPHAVTSVKGATYTYDNNGNVTAIGSHGLHQLFGWHALTSGRDVFGRCHFRYYAVRC